MQPMDELIETVLKERRVPCATYRLQLNAEFTFQHALEIVPYLHDLGITDCYASPILKARAGSPHGYDTSDHSTINPELGGESALDAFTTALREKGMGLILDTVPNHMGITEADNAWWMDVLENGPGAMSAPYFDIDWKPVNPDLDNKLLLPVLEDQYGAVLENGKIRLAYEEGAFFLYYYEKKLPVSPRTYTAIIEPQMESLTARLGEENEHVLELQSILTALSYLPPRNQVAAKKVIERNREKEIIKRRLATLTAASPEVLETIDTAVTAYNGTPDDPQSYDPLDRLIDMQGYRLAFWRVAMEEINYRRFFDINELAAIRVEVPKVFQETHSVIFDLLAAGKATGLRIDHPDGLWNPTRYFRQLQENHVCRRVSAGLEEEWDPKASPTLPEAVAARLDSLSAVSHPDWPLYVVAEKILAENEPLPEAWAVDGTTGYDFLNLANGLFVNRDNEEAFDTIYREFTRRNLDFQQLVNSCQKMIMLVSMASEVNALSHQLDRLSERNRRYRDFTLNSLTFAIREVAAALGVYRTYITGPESISERDRKYLEEAVALAKDQNPRTAGEVFDFIRDTLLLQNLGNFREEDRPLLIEWTMKFQQLTGPVLAKGLEDTAFYIYNRLVSLNEVGGHPERFGLSLEEFHQHNAERLQHWPHSMLASTTHDTKRSEDTRARLNVLSELPDEWQAAVKRWSESNAAKKTTVEGKPAPDRNDEYLFYQTLVGAWPNEPPTLETLREVRERVVGYMQKATKEAKLHTSWINPHEAYDAAVCTFVARTLPDQLDDPFIQDFLPLQRRVAFFGCFNSLSQLVLKMTCPGVPDFYRGTELWDFSLVDPDNRRPVDFPRRREILAELTEAAKSDLLSLAKELVEARADGRIKLFATYATLQFRRQHPALFMHGAYVPLETTGAKRKHVCAFARSVEHETIVIAVPRLVVGLTAGVERVPVGSEVWQDTRITLPPELGSRSYRQLFTGELLEARECEDGLCLDASMVFGSFPVAVSIAERGT